MVRRLARGTLVVDGHVVGALLQQLTEQHGGRGARAVAQVVRGQGERAWDDPVHEGGAEAGQRRQLMVAIRPGLMDQHGQGALLGLADHMPRQLGEVRDVQFGNDQGDDAGAALAQVTPGQVHPVAELFDGLAHHLPGPVGDMGVVVDDIGDRLLRHARTTCDVLDPGPCHRDLPASRARAGLCPSATAPARAQVGVTPGVTPRAPSPLPVLGPQLFTAHVHRCKN